MNILTRYRVIYAEFITDSYEAKLAHGKTTYKIILECCQHWFKSPRALRYFTIHNQSLSMNLVS